MKKLLAGLAALPFMAGVAMADGVVLGDAQMDQVTAGFAVQATNVSSGSVNGANGAAATNNNSSLVAQAGTDAGTQAAVGIRVLASGGNSQLNGSNP